MAVPKIGTESLEERVSVCVCILCMLCTYSHNRSSSVFLHLYLRQDLEVPSMLGREHTYIFCF